jgi:hypothetical protein
VIIVPCPGAIPRPVYAPRTVLDVEFVALLASVRLTQVVGFEARHAFTLEGSVVVPVDRVPTTKPFPVVEPIGKLFADAAICAESAVTVCGTTGGGFVERTMFADANFVESCTEVAVKVTVGLLGRLAGAVYVMEEAERLTV